MKLTDVHRSQMKLFRDTHGWSRIKFIPNADFYVRNPTTLTALFKCLLIETEEDKVKYSRMQFDRNTRVSELVFFLPFNNGFTHISQPFAAAPTQINGWEGTCTTALVTLTMLQLYNSGKGTLWIRPMM